MKKCLSVVAVIICVFLLFLAGYRETMDGTDALIQKAKEEIPIADAENMDVQYAGLCEKDDSALIWFISGNKYQAHYYLPMECTVIGKDKFKFVRTYKPIERGMDIVVLQWNRGYSFLVNNPDCTTIKITDNTETYDITLGKDAYPYVTYLDFIPSEYQFLDTEGNEL